MLQTRRIFGFGGSVGSRVPSVQGFNRSKYIIRHAVKKSVFWRWYNDLDNFFTIQKGPATEDGLFFHFPEKLHLSITYKITLLVRLTMILVIVDLLMF